MISWSNQTFFPTRRSIGRQRLWACLERPHADRLNSTHGKMKMLDVTFANSISFGQTLQSVQMPTTGDFDMHRWGTARTDDGALSKRETRPVYCFRVNIASGLSSSFQSDCEIVLHNLLNLADA